jgi:hypothetical protein
MVELLISMVAGLAVVLSVVAMGRDATMNFHEEMKVASTQMTQRIAAQRLRADLERTGFMATGNMPRDPVVAHCLAAAAAPCTGQDTVGSTPTYIDTTREKGLVDLMSVRLKVGGSLSDPDVAAASGLIDNGGMNPDIIELAGNFTTADEFSASIDQPAGGCSGARIYLETKDPAVLRMLYVRDGTGTFDQTAADNAVRAAFAPVYDTTTNKTPTFGIRVSDSSLTHYQFVGICDQPNSIVVQDPVTSPTGLARAYIDTIRPLMTQDLGIGGIVPGGGAGSGAVVNPVQIVRWEIARRATRGGKVGAAGTTLDTAGVAALSTSRFELLRTWVPFNFGPFANVGADADCPRCVELVAEFAIDLKFGFSVMSPAPPLAPLPPPPPPYAINDYALDDTANNGPVAPSVLSNGTPQLIRSINFRLGTRTALPDRAVTLGGAPPHFLYRYQLAPNQYARARETVEEVFLANQTSMIY